jgi:ribonuclease HII
MKRTLLSTLVASLLLTSFTVADSNTTLTSKEVSANATKNATKKANNNKVELIKEALSSLELSAKALKELNKNKVDDAKKSIELALGKLESILAAKDTPKLLPIENRIVIKNFIGGADDVTAALKSVEELMDKGKIQEAGELLYSLQSEIDMTVISLPLATYPDALKLASKYIIEKNPEKAKEILTLALSTFSEVEQIIPIPLINTVDLVAIASDIAKENKEQALKHLALANDELNKAEKLGYVSKSTTTYKQLHKLIENVEKEVKGPNKAEKLFKELGEKLKEFKEKILSSDKTQNSK